MSVARPLVAAAVLIAAATLASADLIRPRDTRPNSPGASAYHQGVAAFEKGDLATAERLFQESLKLDPGMVSSLLGLAEAAVRRGRMPEAEAHLRSALSKGPGVPEVHRAWGHFLVVAGRAAEAESPLKSAASLDARGAAVRVDLGDLYRQWLSRPQDAAAAYREALALDRRHAGALYALGLTLAQLGEAAEAQSRLEQAVQLAPDNPLAPMALARLQLAKGERDKAKLALAPAYRTAKLPPGVLADRADVALAVGDDARAFADYEKACTLAPKSAALRVRLGMACQLRRDRAGARRAYEEALRLDPDQALALNNLAWMAAEDRAGLDDALARSRKAVKLAPRAAEFRDTLAEVHRVRGEKEQAVAAARKAAELAGDARSSYWLGVAYAEAGRAEEARAALAKAVGGASFPEIEDARRRLAALVGGR